MRLHRPDWDCFCDYDVFFCTRCDIQVTGLDAAMDPRVMLWWHQNVPWRLW